MSESEEIVEDEVGLCDDSDSEPIPVNNQDKGRRKISNPSLWKKNYQKSRRAEGKSYIRTTNEGPELVKGKKFVQVKKCCNKNCFQNVLVKHQNQMFQNFYHLGSKQAQDLYLSGCMMKKEIKLRKAQVDTNHVESLWEYNLKIPEINERVLVCRKLVMNLFQITQRRLRTIQDKLKQGSIDFKEKRGTHDNRPNKINDSVWKLIEDHWSSLPNTPSHYCSKKSKRLYFDNTDLTITSLFEMFQKFYKDKTNTNLKMKRNTYAQYFRKKSIYAIRKPRTDTCDLCEKLKIKIKNNPQDQSSKTTFQLHERKATAYKTYKANVIAKAKSSNNCLALEFDYGQNLPLPKLTVNSLFYKRQLWYFVFNIHCHNNDKSTMYTYLETECSKDPDTVASFVYHYIAKEMETNPNIKEIILMSDNAGGQNKNHKIMMFCSFLSIKYNVKVTQLFPVRGHSYCQCDRNFGAYSNCLHRRARIVTSSEYDAVISNKSELIHGFGHLKSFSLSLEQFFKDYKSLSSKDKPFRIQKYCLLQYHSSGTVLASMAYQAAFVPFNFYIKGSNITEFDTGNIPQPPRQKLKPAKEKDLRALFEFLTSEESDWFEQVISQSKESVIEAAEDNATEEVSDAEEIEAYEFAEEGQ